MTKCYIILHKAKESRTQSNEAKFLRNLKGITHLYYPKIFSVGVQSKTTVLGDERR